MPDVVNLAVEDSLSEAVLRRVLVDRNFEPGATFGKRGIGWLKSKAKAFNDSSRGVPCIMLADLDLRPCAPEVVDEWLRGAVRNPGFLLRIAVREVEAWLLADFEGLSSFLGVAVTHLGQDWEQMLDPKSVLLRAATRSRKRLIRESLAVRTEAGLRQGPDYNGPLVGFVATDWNLERARTRCQSLERLVAAVESLRSRRQ